MGNIISSLHHRIVKSEDIPTPPLHSLTESQVEIVKRTWEIPAAKVSFYVQTLSQVILSTPTHCTFSQPLDSGEKILYLYFERFPHNQQKFSAFRNTPLLMLKGNLQTVL